VIPDEQLDYWAEQFIASGLRAVMTFGAFIDLSVPLRERRLHHAAQATFLQEGIERRFPDAALRGNGLVDPMHHGKREGRRPWFFNLRHH